MPKVYNKRKNAPAEYRNPPPDAVLVDRTTDFGNPLKDRGTRHTRGSHRVCLRHTHASDVEAETT